MATFLLMATLATVVVSHVVTEDVPAECQESTFCEVEPLDHPREVIDEYIEKNRALFENSLPEVNVARHGQANSGLDLCKSIKKVIHPFQARGSDKQWYRLVNRQNNPVQGFEVEICDQSTQCSSTISFFETGYSGRCEQKYIQRSVSVMNRGSDGEWSVRQQLVKLPSCCVCVGARAV